MKCRTSLIPKDIVYDKLAPFLSVRSLFNMAATCREYRMLVERNAVSLVRKEVSAVIPIGVLDHCYLTGGYLLSILTDYKFDSSNVDLIADQPEKFIAVKKLLEAAEWELSGDPKTDKHDILHCRYITLIKKDNISINVQLTRPMAGYNFREARESGSFVTADQTIRSYSMSISRLWLHQKELWVHDLENSIDMGTGFKSFLLEYAQETAPDGRFVMVMETSTDAREKKYRTRGYFLGLGTEAEDSSDSEEESEEDSSEESDLKWEQPEDWEGDD